MKRPHLSLRFTLLALLLPPVTLLLLAGPPHPGDQAALQSISSQHP